MSAKNPALQNERRFLANDRCCIVRKIRKHPAGHHPVEILHDHRQRAAHQVAIAIREIRVVALHKRIERERAILPEHDLAQQKVPQRVVAEHFNDGLRAHDISARLRHLRLLEQQPAVRDNLLRQRQARGHQKCGPVHAVEAGNLLADQVQLRRPVLFKPRLILRAVAERGDVVRERVEPHVDHMRRVVRHRNAPGKAGARDREIAQAAAHEGHDLIAARLRLDELRVLFVKGEQLVFKRGELEEVVLLADCLGDATTLRAGRAGRDLDVGLIGDAVLAAPGGLIEKAALLEHVPQLMHAALVALFRGADEVVVGEAHAVPQAAKLRRNLVGKLLRAGAGLCSRALDLLAVFVGPGQEPHVLTERALGGGRSHPQRWSCTRSPHAGAR